MDQIVNRAELTGNHGLGWVMNPLSIHKELVLVLSLGEVQDGNKVIMALYQWNLGAPIVEGPRDEDLLASLRPADHGGPGLLRRLHGVLQVLLPRDKLLVPRELGVGQAEDAGVVRAPHHDLVLLARAMAAGTLGARSLGAVALPGHPVAGGVSHDRGSSRGPPAAGAPHRAGNTPDAASVTGAPGPAPAAPGEGIPSDPARGNPRNCRARAQETAMGNSPAARAACPGAPTPVTTSGDALLRVQATGAMAVPRVRPPIKLLKLKPRPELAPLLSS